MKSFNAALQDEINQWIKDKAPHSRTKVKQIGANKFFVLGGWAGGLHTRGWRKDLRQQFKGVIFI